MYPADTEPMLNHVALCVTTENALSVISALSEMSQRCEEDGRRVMAAKYSELAKLFKEQYSVSRTFKPSEVDS